MMLLCQEFKDVQCKTNNLFSFSKMDWNPNAPAFTPNQQRVNAQRAIKINNVALNLDRVLKANLPVDNEAPPPQVVPPRARRPSFEVPSPRLCPNKC
jgi:hypothetical protein